MREKATQAGVKTLEELHARGEDPRSTPEARTKISEANRKHARREDDRQRKERAIKVANARWQKARVDSG